MDKLRVPEKAFYDHLNDQLVQTDHHPTELVLTLSKCLLTEIPSFTANKVTVV
jgi:hypothetical protein